jgi:hypothetical protein
MTKEENRGKHEQEREELCFASLTNDESILAEERAPEGGGRVACCVSIRYGLRWTRRAKEKKRRAARLRVVG